MFPTVQIARSNAPGLIETEAYVPTGAGPHPGVLWMHGVDMLSKIGLQLRIVDFAMLPM
eukprot:TRINITY_DN6375_c0_g1_i1.p2 TRINITY_DN6375_c0_g1~~TRINITY_DN6375_c0_g1_i1.p2  ORF type:complete len:59 (+),score=5.14 TRINITY_DN6375_c0_g1_i1:290-466(+)